MKKNLIQEEEETTNIHGTINEFDILMGRAELPAEAPAHRSTKATDGKEKRLNIYIKQEDFKKLKYLSIEQDRTMKDIVEEAISLYLQGK